MTDQIVDKITIGIPGPSGDASPEMVAAAEAVAGSVAGRHAAQAGHDAAVAAIADHPSVAAEAATLAQSDAGLARWVPGFGAAGGFVGENGRETDLVVDAEGEVPDRVLMRWRERLEALSTVGLTGRRLRTPTGHCLVSSKVKLAAFGDSLTYGWPRPPFASDGSDAWPGVLAGAWSGSVANRSWEGWRADEIALWQGGIEATLAKDVTLPADTSSVPVAINEEIHWNPGHAFGLQRVSVGGVSCQWWRYGSNLTLQRNAAGDPVVIPAGTPIVSVDGADAADAVQVILAGRNDIGASDYDPVASVVEATVAMMERPGPRFPRRLLLGTMTSTGETRGTTGWRQVTAINAELGVRYGSSFFDLRRWLIDHALSELGLTPTSADITAIEGDTLPPSIMTDSVHWAPATAALIATKILNVLKEKEWI